MTSAETRIDDLLIAMPGAGEWMLGVGKHSVLLGELLDSDTALIEEQSIAEDDADLLPWKVRLTAQGIVARIRIVKARGRPDA
jgi:hypothetical protein